MTAPKVSFVVPCYRLADLLPACLDSILRQTCADFEILVMDDCSPDHTAEVVARYTDVRIRYVRNEHNLGHLRNYNRGIELSRGSYVWLISADDFLRSTHVLERYVALLESHPSVGFVFCPGYGFRDGVETRVLGRLRTVGDRDRVMRGEALLAKLVLGNFILTPSGMVRRACYEQLGGFRLDMPWCGDWFLWCLFALHFDVGYIAEPMVCYREQHALSMTDKLTRERLDACGAEETSVPRLIRTLALEGGRRRVARRCLDGLAHAYARTLADARYVGATSYMNAGLVEASLARDEPSARTRRKILAKVLAQAGNHCHERQDRGAARRFYLHALAIDPLMPRVALKMALASLGRPGDFLRRRLVALR